MQIGISEIDRLGGHLSIGEEARTIAKTMFRRAVDERLLYGRAAESVAAATVYLGSRRGGVHRGLSEVASLSQVSRRQVARDSRYLQRELDLSIEPPTVTAYLPRIRTALDLDERAGRLARQLLGQAIEANLHSGRDPNGLAASALYTVSVVDEAVPGRSQRAVAAAADVCPETIRRRHRELRDVAPAAFGDDDSAVGLTTDQTRTAGRESRAHPIPDDAGG